MKQCYWLLLLMLFACATPDTHEHAQQLAHGAGLTRSQMMANGFVLTAYSRLNNPEQAINVYIEGDGLAWLSRHQLSADPTPRNALGLALAAIDPAANVLYLARPCQFNDFERTPCASEYWSNKRFAPEVIDAMNQAIDRFSRPAQAQKLNLIAYSGGATVAVLLAARRHDIASLRTVAANLDHAYVNQLHQVSVMPESLNAMDTASNISGIPQLHFVGTADKVIPKEVALRFIAKQRHANCASIIEAQAGHEAGWLEQWQSLLQTPMPC